MPWTVMADAAAAAVDLILARRVPLGGSLASREKTGVDRVEGGVP